LGKNTERKNTWSEGEARAGEIKKNTEGMNRNGHKKRTETKK
jgi:hypothetical protein